MRQPPQTLLLLLMFILTSSDALAATEGGLGVGDKVTFSARSLDGKRITHQSLADKVAVIEFWATWCGPCVETAPHMRKLYETFGSKGVKFLGISLDQTVTPARAFVRQHKLRWPQAIDAPGHESLAQRWQVRGIPLAFVLAPDGTLLWRGHPVDLETALERAIADVPAEQHNGRQDALRAIAASLAALDRLDYQQALRMLATLKDEMLSDGEILRHGATLVRRFEAAGSSEALQSAIATEPQGKAQLIALQVAVQRQAEAAGLPPAPSVAGGVHRVDLSHAAAIRLQRADRQRAAGRHVAAYRLYRELAQQFADTEAGIAAGARAAEYEADEDFIATVRQQEAEDRARSELAMARNYVAAEHFEMAQKKLSSIVEEYPETPSGREAAALLESLR